MNMLIGIGGSLAVVVTAALVAATLRPRSFTAFALAAYLVATAEIVSVSLALSPARLLTRPWFLVVVAALLAAAVVLWRLSGSPSPPALRPQLAALRSALGDPAVAALCTVAVAAYGYLTVVALVVPQVDWDVLLYHLPRAALWEQQHGVGYIEAAPDPRVNGMPVNAEIQMLATMLLARSDRYVGLVQLAAAGASCLALTGVARGLGASRAGALLAATLFATYPVIALQAPTALNDIVVLAPLLAATYFAISGSSRVHVALYALGIALALGTKFTAIPLLPIVVAFVLAARTPRQWRAALLGTIAGAAGGALWYVVNLVQTGSWDAGIAATFEQVPDRAPGLVATRFQSYAFAFLDTPGAVGRDRLLFVAAGAAMIAAAGVVALRRRPRAAVGLVAAAVVVVLLPTTMRALHEILLDGLYKGWLLVGRRDLAGSLRVENFLDAADPMKSAFGPVFVVLAVGTVVLVARNRPRLGRRLPLVVALASPFAFALIMAFAVVFDPLRPRFFAYPVALATATFGIGLVARPLAWAAVALAGMTMALSVVHYEGRPLGVTILEQPRNSSARGGSNSEPLWGAPRWQAQSAIAREDEQGRLVDEPAAFRFLQERIPVVATIALAVPPDVYLYPAFDGRLRRRVVFVPADGSVPAEADWLAVGPGYPTSSCRPGWTRRLRTPHEWSVFERRRGATCPA